MARGATARKRRAQKRRVMRQGVSKAPAQDLVASAEPAVDPIIAEAEASLAALAAAGDEGESPADANQGAGEPTLYQRLGGVFTISALVDYFSDQIIETGAAESNEAIKEWNDNEAATRLPGLKYFRTLWLCALAGGPFAYTGRQLSDAHSRFMLSGKEFNEVAKVLSDSLDHFKVGNPEKGEVLKAFASFKDSVTLTAAASALVAAPGTAVWDSEEGFMDLLQDLECALSAGQVPEEQNYRPAEDVDTESCATCSAFDHGRCSMFNAEVQPSWVCDAWTGAEGGEYDAEVTSEMPAKSWASWRVVDVALSADKAIVCCYQSGGSEYYLVPFTIGSDREPVLADRSEWQELEQGWVTSSEAAAMRFAFASMPACANCDHAYTSHLGTAGPCTMGECGCEGYKGASEEAQVVDIEDLAASLAERTGYDIAVARAMLNNFVLAPPASLEVELPPEHQPADVAPPASSVEVVVTPPEEASSEIDWSAILCPEGKLTSDGRAFAPGAITWPRLDDGPLSLMAMTVTSEGGHVGAELCGRIDKIWRDSAAGLIRGSGVFDAGEYGQEIARLVDERTMRGVSVDLAIQRWERVPRSDWFDEQGNWAPKEGAADKQVNPIDAMYGEDMISLVLEAEIGMTTVCPFPAFAEAQIEVGSSLVAAGGGGDLCWTVTLQNGMVVSERGAPDALTAAAEPCVECEESQQIEVVLTAAAAGLALERPPREWFEDPQLEEATAVMIDGDGRIRGHAALWNVCHIGLPGQCRTAPHSTSGYEYFHLGLVECDDGEHVACGQITIDAPHAGLNLDASGATSHYDHTGTVVAYVSVGEDEHGIWVAGTLAPNASEEKVLALKGAKLSGDWRGINGDLELVALLAVNVPGFPVPRSRALVAAAENGEGEVLSLTAAGIAVFESELSDDDRDRFRALAFAAMAEAA